MPEGFVVDRRLKIFLSAVIISLYYRLLSLINGMSQSTSESVSNYESIESNDSFVSAKSDCEDSSAVDQTMNKFKAITGSKEENNVEPRCSCSHKEPSGGIEKHSLDSINGKDSNPKSNGESEHSLNVAFEHSVRIDAVDVKHSNSASTTKLGSDDVVPVDSGARSLNVTLDHPGHIDGSGLMATGDDTISNSGNVGGVEGDSVTAADLPDVTTNSDDESNVNEEDDVDPDWSTYYSDEEDEENDDDDYEEDGMGSRMDFDDYPYTDSEDDDDHLIDGFEINDSIREAIENEMVERYTFKFKFQHRSSVSDDSVDVCAVCLVSFVDSEEVRRLPCFHLFHTGCVDPWLKKHKRVCPKCRLSINKASDYLNESAR